MNLKDFSKEVELQRFYMDMGKHAFAKAIGINYRTYVSFTKQDRPLWPKNLALIVAFMKSIGKEYEIFELK